MLERGLQHVRVDQDGQHAQGFVVLDEAHAAHVGREVVNLVHALRGDFTIRFFVEIEGEILDVAKALIPLVDRLNVDCANISVALVAERRDEMATNKTAGSRNDYSLLCIQSVSLLLDLMNRLGG